MERLLNAFLLLGETQSGKVYTSLAELAIRVCDRETHAFAPNVPVTWRRVDSGKGEFIKTSTMTDGAGVARAEYVPHEGGRYRIECAYGSTGETITFTGVITDDAETAVSPAPMPALEDLPELPVIEKKRPLIKPSPEIAALAEEFDEPLNEAPPPAPTPAPPVVRRQAEMRQTPRRLTPTVTRNTALKAIIVMVSVALILGTLVLIFGDSPTPDFTPTTTGAPTTK